MGLGLIFLIPLLFNPIWVTALVLFFGIRFMNRRRLWRTRGFRIALGIAAVLYLIDLGFTLRRVHFAWSSPNEPVIEKSIPLPQSIVAVGGCGHCMQLLRTRVIDELIVVDLPRKGQTGEPSAVRLRPGWVEPGKKCPIEIDRRFGSWRPYGFGGFCPIVDPVVIPKEGIFVIFEYANFTANELAWWFKPHFLQHVPPGRVIQFQGFEVQERKAGEVTVLGHQRYVTTPSFLLPMLGCWSRPNNIFWIMPPGDTGCGLWRWMTGGGNRQAKTDWIFSKVLIHDTKERPPQAPPSIPSATQK
jgi:hypothetical protein